MSSLFARGNVILAICSFLLAVVPQVQGGDTDIRMPESATTVTGMVTFVYNKMPSLSSWFVFSDGEASYDVECLTAAAIRAGDRITLNRRLIRTQFRGDYYQTDHLEVLGHETLPPPIDIVPADLNDDRLLFKRVRVTGLVYDVFVDDVDGRYVFMQLAGANGNFYIGNSASADEVRLLQARYLGAKVAVNGVCVIHTGDRYFGARYVHYSHEEMPEVLERAQTDSEKCPPLLLKRLARPEEFCDMRYHSASGRVLAVWQQGTRFLMRLANPGARMLACELALGEPTPSVGDELRVVGFPRTDLFNLRFVNSKVEKVGTGKTVNSGNDIRARDLLMDEHGNPKVHTEYQGRHMRVEGIVSRREHDHLILDCQGCTIKVVLPSAETLANTALIGCGVKVTGVVVVDSDNWTPSTPLPRVHGLFLVMRRSSDLTIVSTPPWWTRRRLGMLVLALIAVVTVLLVIVQMLNRLVIRKSRQLLRERMSTEMARIKTDERRRLAVELHDSLSQNLSGLAFQLNAVRDAMSLGIDKINACLATAERMLDSSRIDLKRCLFDLRNRALEDPDFENAVRTTLGEVLDDVDLVLAVKVSRAYLDDATAHTIFSVLRELAANAVRHGAATRIVITGRVANGRIAFSVEDNGTGFDVQTVPGVVQGHFGLTGIRERVARQGGNVSIVSAPGNGTCVTFSVAECRNDKECL